MADIFYNDAGRLRSVWRLAVFVVAYLAVVTAVLMLANFVAALLLPPWAYKLFFEGTLGFVIQSVLLYVPAALIAWGCAVWLEDLPWRSLGWTRHRGWMRDALFGTLLGGVAVCGAALIGVAAGGTRISLAEVGGGTVKTLVVSGGIFLLGAAAEEMLFRGYPFQTLMRSWPLWVALIPVSVFFALVHLANPNVAPGFTFVNTVLAGVWLGVAYWRTRSLWFPLGLHFGWNWVQGAILGSPVSGIKSIAPHPLLRFAADAGPAWVGGGDYGIEGGAACTLALVLVTLFTWRTGLLKADPELKQFTDGEHPNPRTARVMPT
jgi:membrane protease YdiL (CAAX protease family)